MICINQRAYISQGIEGDSRYVQDIKGDSRYVQKHMEHDMKTRLLKF